MCGGLGGGACPLSEIPWVTSSMESFFPIGITIMELSRLSPIVACWSPPGAVPPPLRLPLTRKVPPRPLSGGESIENTPHTCSQERGCHGASRSGEVPRLPLSGGKRWGRSLGTPLHLLPRENLPPLFLQVRESIEPHSWQQW